MFHISALIVVRDERRYITKALDSLINQDLSKDNYEILIIDGISSDGTFEIAKKYEKKYPRLIRLFENPKGTLAAGWNIGIRHAKADIVVRVDAHAYVAEDFLRKNLEYVNKINDVAQVGGPIESVGENTVGELLAGILNSPFGTGNKVRFSKSEGYVKAYGVGYGAFRKELFHRIGLFDETLDRNQDLDLYERIEKAGWKSYSTPEIRSYYVVKNSLRTFLSKTFYNGYWNIALVNKNFSALCTRHIIPLFFVMSLIFLSLFSFYLKPFFYLLMSELFLYASLTFYFSIMAALKSRLVFLPLFPCLFFSFHIIYGLGSMYGCESLIKRGWSN